MKYSNLVIGLAEFKSSITEITSDILEAVNLEPLIREPCQIE